MSIIHPMVNFYRHSDRLWSIVATGRSNIFLHHLNTELRIVAPVVSPSASDTITAIYLWPDSDCLIHSQNMRDFHCIFWRKEWRYISISPDYRPSLPFHQRLFPTQYGGTQLQHLQHQCNPDSRCSRGEISDTLTFITVPWRIC